MPEGYQEDIAEIQARPKRKRSRQEERDFEKIMAILRRNRRNRNEDSRHR